MPQPVPFQFSCPVTVFKAEDAPVGTQRRIAGIVSTDRVDKQNERILQDGLDWAPFVSGGWFNDDHKQGMADVLGFPSHVQMYKVGEGLPDGTTADANCTWVEGYLLDTQSANQVWELAQALQKTHRRLGYSVEGSIDERTGPDDSIIARATVRNVALTACPVNGDTKLEILARSLNAQNTLLARSMSLADGQGSAGPALPNKPYTGAGAGQVLTRESVGAGRKKRTKSTKLTRSEAVAYVRRQVPGCSEALARAIVFKTLNP